jgi:type IV secretory pathway VirB4 component
MIIFNDLSELKEKLKQCTSEFYKKNTVAIRENFQLAKEYTLAENWIYNNILRIENI